MSSILDGAMVGAGSLWPLESILLLGRVLFPMELMNFLITLVGRTSFQEVL